MQRWGLPLLCSTQGVNELKLCLRCHSVLPLLSGSELQLSKPFLLPVPLCNNWVHLWF